MRAIQIFNAVEQFSDRKFLPQFRNDDLRLVHFFVGEQVLIRDQHLRRAGHGDHLLDLDFEVAVDFVKGRADDREESAAGLFFADDRDEDFAVYQIGFNLGSILAAVQEDAVLPVILLGDVLVHPHDEARDDGVGQRLE